MERNKIISVIREIIEKSEKGSVFVPVDFAEIADNAKIATTLSRLEAENKIRRIMRGVYDKPEYSEFLGEYISPSPNKVAEAIARNFGWTIVPCGDTALNILGLSTQVPAVWVYVSDGTYKKYSFGNTTIVFKRTTNKDISRLSYKTALVIQSIKALGKDNVDSTVIQKISSFLTRQDKDKMIKEAKISTSWIYEIIKMMCKGQQDKQN